MHPDEAKDYPPIEMLSPRTTKPFYSAALTDIEGSLWVRKYADADAGAPRTFATYADGVMIGWQVFDVGGKWLGTVATPARLTVREITSSKVAASGAMTTTLSRRGFTNYRSQTVELSVALVAPNG